MSSLRYVKVLCSVTGSVTTSKFNLMDVVDLFRKKVLISSGVHINHTALD